MRRRITTYLAALVSMAAPFACRASAQKPVPSGDTQQPGYVFRTTSRLVVVDVVATNGKGEPVAGLKAEDFTLLEDGKPQPLRSFSLQSPEAVSAAGQSAPFRSFPPGVISNTPHYRNTGVWNVVLLDFLNSPVVDQTAMRDQLVRILGKLPDQPVAVYVLADKLRLLRDFSSDPAVLRESLAALKSKASVHLDNAKGGHEAERYSPAFINSLPADNLASLLRWEAQSTANRTDLRLRRTLEAFNMIVRNVAALPGRKNLIWVGEGFPFSIEPGSAVNATDAATGKSFQVSVPGTANALLDSQVAIYPVDTRGVRGNDAYDAAGRGFDALGRPESEVGLNSTVSKLNYEQNSTHGSMNELAERTGGRAYYNANDVGDAILRSMNDGNTYYTLAYSPENKNWNGKFRHISVKVNRAGVKLRHRSGYFALDPQSFTRESPQEQAREFQDALAPESPVSTALLFETAVIGPSEKTAGKVVVNFAVHADGLTFETSAADDTRHASLECAAVAFSPQGEPVKSAANRMEAALTPENFTRIQQHGFPCRELLELPAGDYLLRLGVRDNVTGRIGTANATVSVSGRQADKPTK